MFSLFGGMIIQVVTKGAIHHQIVDLRKKIKQTLQDASSCDAEMRVLKEQQQQFGADLDERQVRYLTDFTLNALRSSSIELVI